MPEYLTPKQAAERLQLSRLTIIRYIERGELPAAKIGGQWRIAEADLQAFINARKSTGGETAE